MFRKTNKSILKFLFPIFLLVVISAFFANKTEAASLLLQPTSSSISTGNIVSIKIIVNTGGQAINNAEATIQFPTDLLEVISTTKSSSIFTLWVEEPSFSNSTGKITFNGGVPTPGFNGSNGYVATFTFKAKKQGTASIIFTDGAVRANDGLGTDVLVSKTGGTIKIGAAVIKETEKSESVEKVSNISLPKPVIVSDTHPDQNSWYSNNTAHFSWEIPNGVTSIKTILDKSLDSEPTILYDNSVASKTIKDISDGTSYLHLRFLNSLGVSQVASYKINVDTVSPQEFTSESRIRNNKNIIKLAAQDLTSGIDYYTIQIDGNSILEIKGNQIINNEYTLPALSEGAHNLIITAYDKAQNHTESKLSIVSPSISTPSISLNTNEINSGDSIKISGDSNYPREQIEIIFESEGVEVKKYTQVTSYDGSFSVTIDKVDTTGLITISARVAFSEIAKSPLSEKLYLKVNEGKFMKINLFIIILLLLLIILAILCLIFYRRLRLKRKNENELKQTAVETYQSMSSLRGELVKQLESLENIKKDRNLDEKEESTLNQIKNNIERIDEFVEKKLKKLL